MTAKDRYDRGLITLKELAQIDLHVAFEVFVDEHERIEKQLRDEIEALKRSIEKMQDDADFAIDALYDADLISYEKDEN